MNPASPTPLVHYADLDTTDEERMRDPDNVRVICGTVSPGQYWVVLGGEGGGIVVTCEGCLLRTTKGRQRLALEEDW